MRTEFRLAKENDLDAIMGIIDDGKLFLKMQGVDQWQKGDPSAAKILEDIHQKEGYVLCNDGQVVASVAILMRDEANYAALLSGEWGNKAPYAAIHRIALQSSTRGTAFSSQLMQHIKAVCLSKGLYTIRVDTHRQNIPMQRYLEKNGFVRRGTIFLLGGAEKGAERIVYDVVLPTGQ